MFLEQRKKIDEIDNKLIKLLDKRFKITDQIGQIKKEKRLTVENKAREEEIFYKIEQDAMYNSEIKEIFELIMKISKERQNNL